ncbi:MAG: HAMP domain-containing sensor histidine kinase [Minwuia sp.]|nr:HAMP domain-containing sensor histidine kinase [Minwuia sp.]
MVDNSTLRDSSISIWSGEFRDPDLEHAFRLSFLAAQRRHVTIMGAILLVITIPIVLSDQVQLSQHSLGFWAVITGLSGMTLPASWLIAVRLKASYRVIDVLLFLYVCFIMTETILLAHILQDDVVGLASRLPLYVMIGNVMFPMAARLRHLMNGFGALVLTGSLWVLTNAPVDTLASVTSTLATAYLLGICASNWLSRLRRAEYLRTTQLEQANDALIIANQQMQEANAAKNIFLSNVSHELRTPLNAIIGFGEMLQYQVFGPIRNTKYESYAADIVNSGKYLLDMINDLLDLNKIEAGKVDLQPEWIGLRGAAREWMKMITMAARMQGAERIHVEEMPDLALHADRGSVQQIIANLINNALKYAGEEAEIILSAHVDRSGRLKVTVSDSGVGMTREAVSRLMRPFEQADASTARKEEGWGLGLPLADALAKTNGLCLTVDSKPGDGTTATLTIPASKVRKNTASIAA